MSHDRANLSHDLNLACREALQRFHVASFDNIDVTVILAERPISRDNAEWIGRHLLRHSRNLQAYQAGQEILKLVEHALCLPD